MLGNQQQRGVFFLLFLVFILQGVYFFIATPDTNDFPTIENPETVAFRHKIDSVKQIRLAANAIKIFPFNPNYINDFKAYRLGMTVASIDRLNTYRAKGKFIRSATQFQEVTGISDSLYKKIRPFLRFPDWMHNSPSIKGKERFKPVRNKVLERAPRTKYDLNTATAAQLKTVYGIGDVLSKRIVAFRELLGGFIVEEQLNDVYAISPEAVGNVLEKFEIKSPPEIQKIKINQASVDEIASIAYINYNLAKKIVARIDEVGDVRSFEELSKIEGFPIDKIDRIKLYLTFK